MERGGFAVLEAGQFAFALLVFPTVVPQLLAMAMERLRDAGPPTLMEDREMVCREDRLCVLFQVFRAFACILKYSV